MLQNSEVYVRVSFDLAEANGTKNSFDPLRSSMSDVTETHTKQHKGCMKNWVWLIKKKHQSCYDVLWCGLHPKT
jgi:hypothetical protein